jgi:aminoglycoside phosphotransferase (APT) family kinase protein
VVDLESLAAAHPAIDLSGAAVVDTGWDHLVVDTGEWVFRVPRREAVAAALRVERRLLALLAPRLPVRVPDLSLHTLRDGTVYGLYPRLPGDPAGCDDAAALAGDVGALLTALHAVEPGDALVLGVAAPGKLDLDVLARRATAEVVPLLPWEAVTALHEAFATLREPAATRVVVHADLGESNLLVTERRLSGVIDWSDAHVGDPATDLAWFVQCLGPDAARAALAAYVPPRGTDPDTLWRRAVAHATVQPVHAVLYGLDRGETSYVRKQLARLVPAR